jgi:hypothetical protein
VTLRARGTAPAVLALAVLTLVSFGCGATTYEGDPVPETIGAATAITAPADTPTDLLERLRAESFELSVAIVEGDGADRVAIGEIDAIWAAFTGAEPRTEFVLRAETQIGHLRNAVERKRPADADKAARNLSALIDAR